MADVGYMTYRTAPFSTTLNYPYPRFQGHAIILCRNSTSYKFQWNINMEIHKIHWRVSFRMTLS